MLQAWMVVVIVGRELLVTALRSFLEERGSDFSANLSGKLKMLLQCVAAGSSLVYLPLRTEMGCRRSRVDLLVYGRLDLVGGGRDGVLRRDLRMDSMEDPAAGRVGWDKRALAIAGPPMMGDLELVGRCSLRLACPTLRLQIDSQAVTDV